MSSVGLDLGERVGLAAARTPPQRRRVDPATISSDGARLFDNLGAVEVQLEQVRGVEAPDVTHLKYTPVT